MLLERGGAGNHCLLATGVEFLFRTVISPSTRVTHNFRQGGQAALCGLNRRVTEIQAQRAAGCWRFRVERLTRHKCHAALEFQSRVY